MMHSWVYLHSLVDKWMQRALNCTNNESIEEIGSQHHVDRASLFWASLQ